MYNSHFGFSESPFENNLDQRFLFLCEDHREVLAALMYFILERKGLALVCGDVGTGKTMLINSFLTRLPDTIRPIVIANPLISYAELLHFIAGSLGIHDKKENTLELLDQIKQVLIAARRRGIDYVLIVDEAHLFPDANLEQVRLLSNIEIPESKLLQILLVGQNELSHNLNRPEMRQLRQRININRFLSPLTPAETVAYIDYRLERVGSSFAECFEPTCAKLLYQLTGGVPRLINQLCDNALLGSMADGLQKVNRRILERAHEALRTDVIFAPQARAQAPWKRLKCLLPLAAAAALLVCGLILGRTGFGGFTLKAGPATSQLESIHPAGLKAPPGPAAENPAAPAALAKSAEIIQEKPAAAVRTSPPELQPGGNYQGAPEPNQSKSRPREPEPGPAAAQVSPRLPGAGQTLEPSSPPPMNQATVAASEPPAGAASLPPAQLPRQVEIKAGDTLNKIASAWYPKNVDLGVEAILLANPETINMDLIAPGQKLTLPSINPADQTIVLRENQYYAGYGHYASLSTLQNTLSRLSQQGVRYLVVNTRTNQGNIIHRVLVGSYEDRGALEKALKRLKGESKLAGHEKE